MWFIDENDSTKYSGVESDLVNGITKALGLKPQISNQKWDGLMPAVSSGRYDIVIGSIGDRAARRENITFVNYSTTGTALLVRKEDEKQFVEKSDMCGKSVGYQTGASPGELLKKISAEVCANREPINILPFSDHNAIFPAIMSGQVDAQAIDVPQAYYWADATDNGQRYAAVLTDVGQKVNYGIGIKRGREKLVSAVQAALNGMMKSGEYEEILKRGGISKTALDFATVNSGE